MPVNKANTDRRQLRDYLLGRLPEDLATQFDARLFANDALRQELEEEQNLLVEDFVYQRLAEEEARTFEEQCARSSLLRKKVASLRVLLSALERQHDQASAPFFLNLRQLFAVLSPAVALVLCFAAFLYVRERHRNAGLISQVKLPVLPLKGGVQSSGDRANVVAFLSANVVRGSAPVAEIKIPPAGTALEVQVEVRSSPSAAGDWDVVLLRGDEVVQSSTHVPLHQLGQVSYLSLTIDAVSLHSGSYNIRYSPHADPGATRYRAFRAVN